MRGWLALAAAASAAPLTAQALPGSLQAPQSTQRFERPTLPLTAQPRELPPPPPPPPGLAADSGQRFTLGGIHFDGMTVFTEAEMAPLYAGLVGQEITLGELQAVAARVSDFYRRHGYMLAVAVVPAQDLQGGQARIQVVEGYVASTRFTGPLDGPESLPQNLAGRIALSRPLRTRDLERNLLLIGDLPGVNVQSVLSPSAISFGAADLELVVQQLPAEGFVSFDNFSSRYLGPYALSGGISLYSRLGAYEQIDITGAIEPFDADLAYVQGVFTLPVNHSGPLMGDTLQLAGIYSISRPDLPEEIFPFDTRSETVEWRMTYFVPVIRSRQTNLSARLGFIWRDLENRNTDFPDDSFNPQREHVRVLQPRLTFDSIDSTDAVTLLDVAGNIGLDIFGASRQGDPRLVRLHADGQFFYINGAFARLQPLWRNVAVLARMDYQFSGTPLPTTERFGIGGPRSGTGFPPGALTGDSGIGFRLEGRYGHELPGRLLTGFQAYVRYDWGFATDNLPGPDSWDSLSTIGLGIRLNLLKALAFNPELTHQLRGNPADCIDCRHDTRLLFSLIQRF